MKRRRLARRLLEAAAVAAIAAAVAAFGLGQGYLAGFQKASVDNFFPSAKTSSDIVVVGYDYDIIQRFGFPLPRSVQAQIARNLGQAGSAAIVWDVIFAAPQGSDGAAGNADLASAFQELSDAGIPNILGVDGNMVDRSGRLSRLDDPTGAIAAFDGPAAAGGLVKVDTDGDGVVRSTSVVVETADGKFLPSLSLAAVLAYRGAQIQPVVGPKGVQAGGRIIPTGPDGKMRLNWASGLNGSTGQRSVVSALDVYCATEPATNPDCAGAKPVHPEQFGGKIVFVGATAEAAQDNVKVPIDKSGRFPGVLVHANAANTMLTASYFNVSSDTTTVLTVALLCLLVALSVLFLPLWAAPVVSFLLGIVYLFYAAVEFNRGHIMNLIYPIGLMIGAFVAALIIRYFTETRHRQRVSKLFAQYVPEAVAQQLVDEGRVEQAAEGERLDVSLFFCDLRGFTAMSRSLTPQQVRAMLNEFYDALTDITLEASGTVLKFVGDEVFAVFGAPLPVEHHPQVALECAMEIQRFAPVLTQKLAEMGIPPAYFGIGMNSGEVVAAHVGGGKRRQYDIVGDTVNIGSRMCGQAGKGDIVMPVAMYQILDDPPPAESMGFVSLKNVEVPMELMRIRVDWPDGIPTDGEEARARVAPSPSGATMGA